MVMGYFASMTDVKVLKVLKVKVFIGSSAEGKDVVARLAARLAYERAKAQSALAPRDTPTYNLKLR